MRSSSAPVRRLNPTISTAGLVASFRVSKPEAFAPWAVTGRFDISPRPPATSAFCAVSPQGCAARPELKANAPWKRAFIQKARKLPSKYNRIGVRRHGGLALWDISTSQDWSAPPPRTPQWAPDSVNVVVSGDRNACRPPSGRPRVKRAKRSGDETRERPLWSARQRAGQEGREAF
jgi:hypothetical protein